MTQLHEPLGPKAPEAQLPAPIESAPPRSRWSSRIEGGIGSCLAAAWVVGYFTAGMLEPAPRDPSVMNAWYVTVINTALLGSLGVMVLGLIAKRRFGVFASVVATAAFATAVVACPITGHHSFGAWWFGEVLCVAGVAAATGYALHATRA
jgi:hypothetical protein